MPTTTYTVASTADLNAAIQAIDLSGSASAPNTAYTISFAQSFTLVQQLYAINLAAGDTLTIQGNSHTLDGGSQFNGFFDYAGTVGISDLTIANAKAVGGVGSGGGAGLGGGLFIASAGRVTLSNVSFTGDSAVGGDAYRFTGVDSIGGGGLDGGTGGDDGGGGGIGLSATGGSTNMGITPGAGIVLGAASGGNAGTGVGGTSGGGGASYPSQMLTSGGGGGIDGGSGQAPEGMNGGSGGSGGFGGGGGAGVGYVLGSSGSQKVPDGGVGGFGGGGGSGNGSGASTSDNGRGGDGGFGGGGGYSPNTRVPISQGGFGAGNGNRNGIGSRGGGGGGLGAGGAVFVQEGGSLTYSGGSVGGGSVAGGLGYRTGGNGYGFGAGLFIQGNQLVTLSASTAAPLTIGDVIADQTGSYRAAGLGTPTGTSADGTPNAGAGGLLVQGPGTVTLSGANTYSGGTTIGSGTLSLQNASAAGFGAITFGANSAATLLIGDGDVPVNTIGGFALGETIDLAGVGLETTITSGTVNVFTFAGGTSAATLNFDPAQNLAGFRFLLASDSTGGTKISLATALATGITGLSGSATNDNASVAPFAGIVLTDNNINPTASVTVTWNAANGILSDATGGAYSSGTYTVSGTPAAVQAALRALVFIPTMNEVAPGSTVTTTFALSDTNAAGLQSAASTTVIATSVNDPASITGTSIGAVPEDGAITAAGTLTVIDPDVGQASFVPPSAAALAGAYGSFTFNPATGAWTYALTNAAANVQALAQGQQVTDKLTVSSTDGTASQTIAVTITGTNDAPSITGTVASQATSDNAIIKPFATATIADVDAGAQDSLTINLSNAGNGKLSGAGLSGGTNGVYTLAATDPASLTAELRALTFTPTANQVAPGQTVTTSFTLAANDGLGGATTNNATSVLATSINDPASITGVSTGGVREDGTLTASGMLGVNDPDVGQSSFATPSTAALTGTYGSFTFNPATGVWTYALTNAAANVQALAAGQTVTDALTVASLDGTASRAITVTIAGNNDAPVITGTMAGQTTTDYAAIRPFTTASIGDVDTGARDSLTITLSNAANGTLSGTGLTGGTSGVYTLAATDPATLTTELRALTFTPTQHQVSAGKTVTTTVTLAASDGIATTTNTTTSITTTALNYVSGRFLLLGTPGADVITAFGTGNVISGLGGADFINAGDGLATVTLGDGNASVTLGGSLNTVIGANGNTSVTGAPGGYTAVALGNGNNTIALGGAHDTVTLGAGINTVTVSGGMAFITTGAGNDSITLGGTGNWVNAGAGTNTIVGGTGSDIFVLPAAGSGFDTISGFTETNGDVLDLRAALAATSWNHAASTLGTFLKVSNSGGNTNLAIVPRGSSTASAIATLTGTNYGLADLVSHHSILTT